MGKSVKVLCEGEKIISKGLYDDSFTPQSGQTLYDDIEFSWINGYTKNELYNDNGKSAVKTPVMLLVRLKAMTKIKMNERLQKNILVYLVNFSAMQTELNRVITAINDATTVNQVTTAYNSWGLPN